MMVQVREDIYLQIDPADVWSHFKSLSGVFRGNGGAPKPVGEGLKLVKGSGVRPTDFWMVEEAGVKYVLRHSGYGLSFSSSIERLEGKTGRPRIKGRVWRLERGAVIPDGLCINFDKADPGHLLLGVSRKMKISELVELLSILASRMKPTNVVVK